MHIYVVTCLANGKVYVGQTSRKSLRRYFLQKLSDAIKGHPNKKVPFYNAIRKYGREAFVVEEMFCPTSKRQMDMLEKSLIRILNARHRDVGYNVTAGGEGTLGVKVSESGIIRRREQMKGKRYALGLKRSDEQKDGMRQRMMGNTYGLGRKPTSPKHIAALAANSFANKTPEEFAAIKKLADDAHRKNGWVISEETKKKISDSTKDKPKSETTKQRMRVAFLARTTHEERCALSKMANDKRWAKVRELAGSPKKSS